VSWFPDRSDPESSKAYDNKVASDATSLRANAEFYFGLAELEEIDLDAYLAGKRDGEPARISNANAHFKAAREQLRAAGSSCRSFTEMARGNKMLGEYDASSFLAASNSCFAKVEKELNHVIAKIDAKGLPTLSQLHNISSAMQEELLIAARKSVDFRGTPGHFPGGSE